MQVKATKQGFHGGSRRRAGEVFVIADTPVRDITGKPRDFAASWMEEAPAAKAALQPQKAAVPLPGDDDEDGAVGDAAGRPIPHPARRPNRPFGPEAKK